MLLDYYFDYPLSCCSVCSLAIAGVIGNELSDMIDALDASERHVGADFVSSDGHLLMSKKVTSGFGLSMRSSTLLLIKPCHMNKSLCSH